LRYAPSLGTPFALWANDGTRITAGSDGNGRIAVIPSEAPQWCHPERSAQREVKGSAR